MMNYALWDLMLGNRKIYKAVKPRNAIPSSLIMSAFKKQKNTSHFKMKRKECFGDNYDHQEGLECHN